MRALRPVALTLAFAATCAGGVAAGSVLTPDDQVGPPIGEAALRAVAGSDAIGARIADPDGGPEWAVRRYASQTGLGCVEAGRLEAGRFGRRNARDGVDELPVDDAGTCAVRGREPLEPVLNRYPATDAGGARTVLFGRATSDVERIEVEIEGRATELPASRDGTFILVLDGLLAPRALPITVTLQDGSTRRYDWR